MTAPDTVRLERASGRIVWLMVLLGAAGAGAMTIWHGWRWGAGFVIGTAISWLNFRWLKRLTQTLGDASLGHPGAMFLAARYFLLGGSAYVILRYSSISLTAALAGLFVSTAAVIVEILFELVYGQN